MTEITLQQAIEKLSEELSKDKLEGSYYYSWQANIAMSFFDCVRNEANNSASASAPYYLIDKDDLHKICNDAAKSFLEKLIKRHD